MFMYVFDERVHGFWLPICRKEVLKYIKSSEILVKKTTKNSPETVEYERD